MDGRALTTEQIDAIHAAVRREDIRTAMADFYSDLDAAIAAHQPECRNRGACCRFREFGHSLYVTTLEVAYFLARHPSPTTPTARSSPDGCCPFHVNGQCTTRQGRPMGCRIFYCKKELQHWQGPMTEAFLARLKALHARLGVPYLYAEWLATLDAVGSGPQFQGEPA